MLDSNNHNLTSNQCTARDNGKNQMNTCPPSNRICLGSKTCTSGSRRCECKCPCTAAHWLSGSWSGNLYLLPAYPKSIQKHVKFNHIQHSQPASSLPKHHSLFCASEILSCGKLQFRACMSSCARIGGRGA